MPRRIIVVAGQSGSGKDYLVERANTRSIVHAGWGALFAAIVGQDRDQLTYRPDEQCTDQVQQSVMKRVIDMQPVVVTSHPIKFDDGTMHVNWDIERELAPAHHVFVHAPPEIIAARLAQRNRTSGRISPIPDIETIAYEQEAKLKAMVELSRHVGSSLLVLYNTPDNVEANVAQLASLIDQL